jgi:hypothetical protein
MVWQQQRELFSFLNTITAQYEQPTAVSAQQQKSNLNNAMQ